MINSHPHFLLVEPISKTPYPPLGLLKISSMLKHQYPACSVFSQVGESIPDGIGYPQSIYITSLFTWDIDKVINSINFYRRQFPRADLNVGGIAASLLPDYIHSQTGVKPHIGLLDEAEFFPPDYTHTFGRKHKTSITFMTRGCIRKCAFCNVKSLEPSFFIKSDWEKDISMDLHSITFWDNNWLASPNIEDDCNKIRKIGKKVDFNQGLDARLYDENMAQVLSNINIDPIRFAFDQISYEDDIIKAIHLAKKYSKKEIRVYVLYNFKDSPEDLFHRINLLNRYNVLVFPMEYREPSSIRTKFPGQYWDLKLLRAFKLTLLFYYRKGMITESRESFIKIYGTNPTEFKESLYQIYRNDKSRSSSKLQ